MMRLIYKYWKVLSFGMIILFTITYFFILVGIRDNWQDNCLNFLSTLSAFSSIVGIGITIWQIGKISNDLENYKNMQLHKKQSVVIEKIRNAKKTIREGYNDYNIAIYQADEIKELIIKTSPYLKPNYNRLHTM